MAEPEIPPKLKKSSAIRRFAGVAMLVLGLGAGYFVEQRMGLVASVLPMRQNNPAPPEISSIYVPIEPVIVEIDTANGKRHLKFSAAIQTSRESESYILAQTPRISNVFNLFLNVLDENDLDDPSLVREVKKHLFTRLQTVIGKDVIEDVLIVEFMIS